jgi:hypothetical protein
MHMDQFSQFGLQIISPSRVSYTGLFIEYTGCSHHAEGLVNPKVLAEKKVTDFGYPRACRFTKHQIENRSSELRLLTFFKM